MAGTKEAKRRVGGPGSAVSGAVARGSEPSPASWVADVRGRLASLDVESLSDRERVDLVAELERLKGAAAAGQARATDALRCSREVAAPQDVARSLGSEVALARREPPNRGDRFVGLARALVHEMPETMRVLSAGACSERHALAMVRETACLSAVDRGEVDRRVGPLLGRLGLVQAERAAARVAAEIDAAGVVRRMEAAVASRRVSVRPAPDGMAYLTVLGPLKDVVGAHAAVQARSRAVAGGQCPDEAPEGRGVGAVAADTALRLLSGRSVGQVQPVEVHLVMTDRTLTGFGDPDRSVLEPARIPGHGPVPAPVAREWLRQSGPASVWLRRLFTTPDGRDLVAMDSRRRVFSGLLRRVLVLRDDVCTTPWCGALIAHADHTVPAREGGPTSFDQGSGKCARCNHTKEAPGWRTRTLSSGVARPPREGHPGDERRTDRSPGVVVRVLRTTTPTGRTYDSVPPPLLGWGSESTPSPALTGTRLVSGPEAGYAPGPGPGAAAGPRPPKRHLRREGRATKRWPGPGRRPVSHLERRLCRLLR